MKKVKVGLIINFSVKNFAFTLLEVMIAVSIFTFSIIILIQMQSRSVSMSIEAKNLIIATGLAKSKLLDCKIDLLKNNFTVSNYYKCGNFADDGFQDFKWECHSYYFNDFFSDIDLIVKENKFKNYKINKDFLFFVFKTTSKVMRNSIKELVTIVSWGNEELYNKVELTTHIIDLNFIADYDMLISKKYDFYKKKK